jgi:type II secretion system protein N
MWLRIGRWALFALFFVTVLVMAVYLTFPKLALKTFLKSRIETAIFSRSDDMLHSGSVEIGDASLWRLSGTDMRDLLIQEGSNEEEKGPKWKIDTLQVRFGIWSMLFGRMRIEFSSDLYGASANGAFNFTDTKQLSDFWLEMDDLDLSKMAALGNKLGVPLRGTASLDMEFDAGNNPSQDAAGYVNVEVANFGIGDGNLKLMGFAFPVANAKLGKFEAQIDIAKGNAKSKMLRFLGGDVEADTNLTVKLDKDIMRSRAEGGGWFKAADAYLEKASSVKASLMLAERYKETDGKFYFKLNGPLNFLSPSFAPKAAFEQKGPNSPVRNLAPKR